MPIKCSVWLLPLQVRADLNVPLDKDLNITDDTRIRAAIPTLKYLVENGAKVLLTSHLVSASSTFFNRPFGFPPRPVSPQSSTRDTRGAESLSPRMQGRPKDGPEDKFRLTPVVPRLEQLLGSTVSSDPALVLLSCLHGTPKDLDCSA